MNGIELRSIRKKYGLTQIELADKIKITPKTIREWEKREVLSAKAEKLIHDFVNRRELEHIKVVLGMAVDLYGKEYTKQIAKETGLVVEQIQSILYGVEKNPEKQHIVLLQKYVEDFHTEKGTDKGDLIEGMLPDGTIIANEGVGEYLTSNEAENKRLKAEIERLSKELLNCQNKLINCLEKK